MGMSSQRHTPAAFYPRERTPDTHWTAGLVDPRSGLDTEVRRKILCPCRGSNLDRPVVQSVARHYTDGANPAPLQLSTTLNIKTNFFCVIHNPLSLSYFFDIQIRF
jgi:hypothetical protein